MPKRTFEAIMIYTGDDCTVHYPNEEYVYSELRRVFGDGDKLTVEIKSRTKNRSLDQNSYLHMALQMIADETGNELEQVKATMKMMYAKKPLLNRDGDEIFDKNTGEVAYCIQDTRDMSTIEMMEFVDKIRLFAAEFLNFEVPLPDENIKLKFNN